jgi:molybdate transport system substrate-binding protein
MTAIDAARPLRVFAPGSLMGVADELSAGVLEAFPGAARPVFTFAMTGELADRLLAGEGADVAIFANRAYASAVYAAGLMSAPRPLAGNRLTMLRLRSSSATIETLDDLAKPGVRVAVMPPDRDPCGAYTAALFEREGLAGAMAAKLAAGEVTAVGRGRLLPSLLTGGAIDALILYGNVAALFADAAVVVPLPPERDMHEAIEFTIGRLFASDHPLADRFCVWLLEGDGQARLRNSGFLPPPAERP